LNNIKSNFSKHTIKRYIDLKNYFLEEDEELIIKNPIIYEIFEAPIEEKEGELMFLITILYPGKVKDEFFMTRGHYHILENTAEIYIGLQGEGLVLCQTKKKDFEVVNIFPNKIIYIPPCWAHRTVNITDKPLIFFGVYPANAGHDYETIEKEGFIKRVFIRNGNIEIK
jgi:glucose-6-phosphate isomerase